MLDVTNLRVDVPNYDTAALAKEWSVAAGIFHLHNEARVFRAMSIGTRRILFQAMRAMGAKDVLDIGTYNGTSALNAAIAVGSSGHVVTVDIVDINAPNAFWKVDGRPHSPRQLMQKCGVDRIVEFVTQDATEYLKQTDRTFDLICIDSSKSEQGTYDQMPIVLSRLNPNGIVFIDDVFADGKPMPDGYYEPGHWLALKRYMDEGAPIKVIPLTRTLEGARIACAWVIRA